ncbi:MAG: DNA-binding HxlR family transcriptional regulator [Limisphaerales bacterium]|jgi:DNA-binding HxlR family transcriptional regulator
MRRSDCPLSCSLEIIGDKWSMLILRDILFFGKISYGDFLASKEGISTNILANRLKTMVAYGLLNKTVDATNRQKNIYTPTDKAKEIIPVLTSIGDWGGQHFDNTIPIPYQVTQTQSLEESASPV